MTGLKRRGRLVREHAAAGHIDHGGEVNEALLHRDVGGVDRLDLIGARDLDVAQQVRVDRVPRAGFAGAGFWCQRVNIHPSHECAEVATTDPQAFFDDLSA